MFSAIYGGHLSLKFSDGRGSGGKRQDNHDGFSYFRRLKWSSC